MARQSRGVRLGALALFAITVVKVFLVDLAALSTLYRFISSMGLGLLLLIGAYLYYRNTPRTVQEPPNPPLAL
jgi:uncharacterized membrane protein